MKSIRFEQFAGFTIPRTLFFGIMGVVLLAIPSFAANSAFYAVTGYLLLSGIYRLVRFILWKNEKSLLDYASAAVSVVIILFSLCSMAFTRYLANVSPLYLGVLFLIEGVYFFNIALFGVGALQRGILFTLSVLVFLGGIGVVVFTFGFGVGGLSGLAIMSGIIAILSCAYAFVANLFFRNRRERFEVEITL